MTLSVLERVLKNEGLTLLDFATLLCYYSGGTKSKISLSAIQLKKKGLLRSEGFELVAVECIEKIIDGWLNNTTYERNEKERYLELANKLRALYPEGRKAGTNYMWRDSQVAIAKKLKSLTDKFGAHFTDEQAIEATKRYIASFNGDYRFMQLLKYFILKRDNDKQEETSQLLSFIENKDMAVNYEFGEIV